ncbi:hypothetical protein D9613_004044 [Agrocybe pediades]|uniref:Uncharacterized protein n=1 Tax=Agrocybe pediades TaxID=84607 RepID=A0A8H4QIU6_9AGAR|nr:hypothetical protein D9613_004044 [Agrocybe pediades]
MILGTVGEPLNGDDLDGPRMAMKVAYEILKRAPQATTPDPTNTAPFFPDPSTFKPPENSAASHNDSKNNLAKSILEYLFLGVVLLVVLAVVFRRFLTLKRSNQPLTAFFVPTPDRRRGHIYARQTFPRTTGLPPIDPRNLVYPEPHLTGMPAAYRGINLRRVQAEDVDIYGRRLGHGTELDHDGVLGDKDHLPAYDNIGGPPKYAEIELQTRLFGNDNRRPQPVERLPTQGAGSDPELESSDAATADVSPNAHVSPSRSRLNDSSPA